MLEWRQKLDDWARRGSGGDAYTRWEVRVGHLKGLFQPRLWASDSENWWTLFPIIGGWCPLHKPPLTSLYLLPAPSPLPTLPFSLTLNQHFLGVQVLLMAPFPLISWLHPSLSVPTSLVYLLHNSPWRDLGINLPLPSIPRTAAEPSPSPAQTVLLPWCCTHSPSRSFQIPLPNMPLAPYMSSSPSTPWSSASPPLFISVLCAQRALSQLPCPHGHSYSPSRFWSVWCLPSPKSDLDAPLLCFPMLTASFC